jgi:hypothetical protein
MDGERSAEAEIRSEPEREIARVAYSIAPAALDEQHAAVRDLLARTGALLTATSVVVSFYGDCSSRYHDFDVQENL